MTRLRPCLLCLCLVASAAGCTSFSEVDAAMKAAQRPAPKLTEVEGILEQADALGESEVAATSLGARAAALQARAAQLRSQ